MGHAIINSKGQIEIVNKYDKTVIGVVSDFNYSPGTIEVNLFPYIKDIDKTDNRINSRFDILDIR